MDEQKINSFFTGIMTWEKLTFPTAQAKAKSKQWTSMVLNSCSPILCPC